MEYKFQNGDKLVIMTDHLYTPVGKSGCATSSKFKGKAVSMVELLEAAKVEGIDFWHGIKVLSLIVGVGMEKEINTE